MGACTHNADFVALIKFHHKVSALLKIVVFELIVVVRNHTHLTIHRCIEMY